MSLNARRELTEATRVRYHKASSAQKSDLLDQFVSATGYHRKYAVVLLNRPLAATKKTIPAPKRTRKRTYDKPVERALVTLWKASNCLCSKRLVPFLEEFLTVLTRCSEISLDESVKAKLLSLSPATCDRLLKPHRRSHGKTTTKPGTLLKHQIPIRTFSEWKESEQRPGFCEIDLVAHCGATAVGEFAYTLTVTDVFTGWTYCVPVANRGQIAVVAALETIRSRLPFPLLGIDSDNGSEFLNDHLLRYCEKHKITFTRCRPYKKNDQCFVEQKNWSVVRRMVGYYRYEGELGIRRLRAVYAPLNQYQNFFQPSLKLKSKERHGARVRKDYHPAQTPYRRLLDWAQFHEVDLSALTAGYEKLNPVVLLAQIEAAQGQLIPLEKTPLETLPR